MLLGPVGTSRAGKLHFRGTSLTSVCSAPMVIPVASQPRLEQGTVLNSNLLSDVPGEIPSRLRTFWGADRAADPWKTIVPSPMVTAVIEPVTQPTPKQACWPGITFEMRSGC